MMQGLHAKQRISTATTTDIATNSLTFINLNKALAGTVTVQEITAAGTTTVAVYAVGTPAQTFLWDAAWQGTLRIITSAADDLTVLL